MCPIAVLGLDLGYSSTTVTVQNVVNVQPGDIVPGMAAMIDDEILDVLDVTLPTISVARGCADTVPAVHRAGAVMWFFSRAMASDNRAYTAGDTIAVKLQPYSVSGSEVPLTGSPPNNITFNWRHMRPYPPARVRCKGTPWFNELKEMPLGVDTIDWTWVHRDRLLQADQLIGHNENSIGPEPGTTYMVEVYNADDVLVRTVSGIVGTSWTYTRAMAEADAHTAAQAYVMLYSMRDGLRSLQGYRTNIQLTGANAVTVNIADQGWPGIKTDCGVSDGILVNAGQNTWDSYDIAWDGTEDEWQNIPSSPMSYEHPPVALPALGEYRLTLPVTGSGTIVAELATSTDGISYTSWAAPVASYVNCSHVKARFTVSGPNPALTSARISYFRRS